MKLEVGMYVRTDIGKIGKIVYFKERDSYPYSYDRITIDSERYTRTTRNVIKASHNLIDLIEVGDFVNGSRVDSTPIGLDNKKLLYLDCSSEMLSVIGLDYLFKIDIEEVLTHEQYEANCYKVVE